ncbi:DUF2512 family protein [Tumebacillus flagellatus]|uniref:Integral membrane protein n=1 Tax=Tumebacillus flagellatus TaxID=1157490 RepID=A0A074LJ51_9BACL|nr:DUF2512 family protein [Tumebacillus flagellatus]KEO81114.1 hypothetical protein EL26_22510 [Tumebacillus flagellatus]
MNQVLSFFVKYLLTIASLAFVALFAPRHGYLNLTHTLVLGLVITVVNFIIDLIVPRAVNSFAAGALEFVVTFVVVKYGYLMFWDANVNWYFALFCALTLALADVFYHAQFVRRKQM